MRIYRPNEEEYRRAEEGTVFSRLSRGLIRGNGNDRLDLLHRLSTGPVGGLTEGQEGITILTSEKGRVIEVVRVLAFSDHVLMLLQGSDVEEVRAWLDKYTIMDDFETVDQTAEYEIVGVYGDRAKALLEDALDVSMPDTGAFATADLSGNEVAVLRDVRLSGSGSFTLILPAGAAGELISRLTEAGASEIGDDTRNMFRIEVGQPEAGAELTGEYNPLEAGLVSYVAFDKGCYIGQEVIARLDTYDKVKRRLMGIVLEHGLEEKLPANGETLSIREPVEDVGIGTVTSAARSYRLGELIGLAYVRSAYATPGLPVEISVANEEGQKTIGSGTLAKLPF